MMTRAYREIYLSKAQAGLGDAFDYAVNACGISGEDFVNLFCVSTVSRRMAKGEPSIVAGKSGIEIALDVMLETTGKILDIEPVESFSRSREYWIGWAIAYYQWCSDRSYSEIFKALSFAELQKMYDTLHEADISRFVDIADARIREVFKETNLKRLRTTYGYTQAGLAEASGVKLRSIQMYEQRRMNINKASVENLYRMAKALGCSMEDLIEK